MAMRNARIVDWDRGKPVYADDRPRHAPVADTPAPIATPEEEVEQRDLIVKIDHAANAWYIAPPARMPPPYLRQAHVEAIVDWASDGSFAGLEILWDSQPDLTSSKAEIEKVKRELDEAERAKNDTIEISDQALAIVSGERDDAVREMAWEKRRADEAEASVASLTAQVERMREALTKIAGSHYERIGYDQTDIDNVPDLSAEEAMNVARAALSLEPKEPSDE